MKFKISKKEIVEKTNLFGKPLMVRKEYRVYRSLFFGLIRMYIQMKYACLENWKTDNSVTVDYTNEEYATVLYTEDDAKELIRQINENPDKFVRRL